MAPTEPAKRPTTKKSSRASPKTGAVLLAPDGWRAIHTVAVADDGRVFAGARGEARVCAWAPDGTHAWNVALDYAGEQNLLGIQLVGEQLLVNIDWGSRAFLLAAASGAVTRTIDTPRFTRTLALSPDGTRLVARVSQAGQVFALPDFTPLATLEPYANEDSVVFSPDGTVFAYNGHEVHVFDGKTAAHRATFQPPDPPNAMIFDRAGAIVTGDCAARVMRWDPSGALRQEIDTAPNKKSVRAKPTILGLAASERHVAAAHGKTGDVVVYDAAGTLVATFPKHETMTEHGSSLRALAFSADGRKLYVGAVRKGGPVGVNVYDVP